MLRRLRWGGLPMGIVVAVILAACDTGTAAHVTKPAGPDLGIHGRARRDSNPQPSDP
jgi:hypothetical protein